MCEGMGRGWGDLGVASRRRQSELHQLRRVVAVNQVVRHAGMVGFDRPQLFQDRSRLLSVRKSCVIVRLGSQQRQCIEGRCLAILGITLVGGFHGFGIRIGSIMKVALLAVVETFHGSDIVTLAIGLGVQRFRLLDLRLTTLQSGCVRLVPELVPDAHGDSPVRHCALRIVLRDLFEFLLRFLIPERVQQRDTAFEGL
jgi:hypothetical protein